MCNPLFQLGDYVQRVTGPNAGKAGTVKAVITDPETQLLTLEVRHWETPTKSVVWVAESAANYELIEACPPEMSLFTY